VDLVAFGFECRDSDDERWRMAPEHAMNYDTPAERALHGFESNTGALGGLLRDDPAAGVFRVHRRAMVDNAVFDAEMRAIFDHAWLYLGHESEVPNAGDFRTRSLAGRPLLLCRGEDGTVRAFLNVCPHRGTVVCRERQGNAKSFTCFYHSWTFRLNGERLPLPNDEAYSDDAKPNPKEAGLRLVPRQANYRGFIFISFDAGAPSIEEYLAGARVYLDAVADHGENGMEVIAGSQLYSARGNWKLLVENTIDFLHTVPVHQTYFKFLRDFGTDLSSGVSGRGYDLGNGHAVVAFRAGWGRPVARWEPSWGDAEKSRIADLRVQVVKRVGEERAKLIADTDRNLCLFPNLLINDIMATVLRQANPVAPGYMEITQWALAPKGEDPASRARRLHAFNTFLGPGGFATPDDIEAFEGCQRGFGAWRELEWSDYSRGYRTEVDGPEDKIRSDHELQIRAFYRRWHELISAGMAP
jgi:p-cumate 2,3-dioxygenase alpha subunit